MLRLSNATVDTQSYILLIDINHYADFNSFWYINEQKINYIIRYIFGI